MNSPEPRSWILKRHWVFIPLTEAILSSTFLQAVPKQHRLKHRWSWHNINTCYQDWKVCGSTWKDRVGGIGTRGPGETEIETDRRIVKDKISLLRKRLGEIDKQSFTQRKERGELIRVSLVGYTNVGKARWWICWVRVKCLQRTNYLLRWILLRVSWYLKTHLFCWAIR